MVTYEISSVVDAALYAAFERYMTERHIPDVLATGHFSSAAFCRDGHDYLIRYEVQDQATLDQYLNEDAEVLRVDVLANFPSGVQMSRRVWEVIAAFSPPLGRPSILLIS